MHAVTALIPVKQYVPEYLREAVGSLLAQTSPRWRSLVIDPRGARAELQAQLGEAVADARIELVEEEGRQLAGALNTGMRAAETEFTSILFADDLWAPEAVEVLERNIAARRPISEVAPAEPDVRLETFLDRAPIKHLLCWRRELALSIAGIDAERAPQHDDGPRGPRCARGRAARERPAPEQLVRRSRGVRGSGGVGASQPRPPLRATARRGGRRAIPLVPVLGDRVARRAQ